MEVCETFEKFCFDLTEKHPAHCKTHLAFLFFVLVIHIVFGIFWELWFFVFNRCHPPTSYLCQLGKQYEQ